MGELTSKYESFGLTMETCTIYKLLNKSLSIPEYQRPYEWSERLVTKLFEDINKHFFTNGSDKPNNTNFYLGSILLHRDDKYINNIIDGQQRLVTLLIADYVINDDVSLLKKEKSSLNLYNNISKNNVLKIKKHIEKIKGRFTFTSHDWFIKVLYKCIVTVVSATDEKLAFQIFDSLNSKGRKLDIINILKSYHLREITDTNLQTEKACSFDAINATVECESYSSAYEIKKLDHFISLLWVQHHYWINGNFKNIRSVDVERHLQKNAISPPNSSKLTLYPSFRNQKYSIYSTNGCDTCVLLKNKKPFEFNPLHPVQKGLGFFLSIEEMHMYFENLFAYNCNKSILKKVNKLVKDTHNTHFLHFYYLILMAYYVKFGDKDIDQFAFEVEQTLGRKLLELRSVRKESPRVILRDHFNIIQQIYLQMDNKSLIEKVRAYKLTLKIGTDKTEKLIKSRVNYISRAIKVYTDKEESIYREYCDIKWSNIKLISNNDEQ